MLSEVSVHFPVLGQISGYLVQEKSELRLKFYCKANDSFTVIFEKRNS